MPATILSSSVAFDGTSCDPANGGVAAAALWILIRAERSIVSADETLRTLARYGLSERVIRQYLRRQPSTRLSDGEATRAGQTKLPQPPTTHGAG
jgi:hypothetical protein